ncbi:DUF6303 family protein [Streptomyces sp. NPDC050788]|uniref:DUF6303 family protein n=1 Tax=Streptomyces sp. NPDC050788 TaxID=3155041 RepID=UPI00343B942E
MNSTVTRAGIGWAAEENAWVLHLVRPELELEPISVAWPEHSGPPSLLDRYDALAELGFAVVQGGPEAWEWVEKADEQGRPYVFGWTEVRPLTDREVAARVEAQDG